MSNVVALQSGGKIAGIVPQTMEDVFRLAKAVALSGLAPQGMKTPEQLTVAILHGLELGLPPMQSIQRIAVVNGRPTVWGDAIPALLQSRGFKLRESMSGGAETRCATCEIERPDGQKIVRQFSKADACTAGLWGKAGPWKSYPDRMMQMRARGYAARDGAADVLAGLYLREEVEDDSSAITPAIDVTPSRPALVLPDIPDEAPADPPPTLDEARDEILEHMRTVYDDLDWSELEGDYDAKYDELHGGQQ
jgi:hypothetical protein